MNSLKSIWIGLNIGFLLALIVDKNIQTYLILSVITNILFAGIYYYPRFTK